MNIRRALVPLALAGLVATCPVATAVAATGSSEIPVPVVGNLHNAGQLAADAALFGSAQPAGVQLYRVAGSYDLCAEDTGRGPDDCRWERLETGAPSSSWPAPTYAFVGKDLPDVFYLDVSSGRGTAALDPQAGAGRDIRQVASIRTSPRIPIPGSSPSVAVGVAE